MSSSASMSRRIRISISSGGVIIDIRSSISISSCISGNISISISTSTVLFFVY